MIAVDTNVVIAYFKEEASPLTDYVDRLIAEHRICFPPVVVSELLSDLKSGEVMESLIASHYILALSDMYWHRAGRLRAHIRDLGRKAPLADTLIAQSCLDHHVPLLTRNQRDFCAFAEYTGLKLVDTEHPAH